MGRFGFVAKRLLQTIPMLFGIVLIVFLVLQITPGDPARQIVGLRASEAELEEVREELGLDDTEALARTYDHLVVTAALDDFVGRPGSLAWRGIEMRSRYLPTDAPAATLTPAYVVNRPSERVPYTRTVETKHPTGMTPKLVPGDAQQRLRSMWPQLTIHWSIPNSACSLTVLPQTHARIETSVCNVD